VWLREQHGMERRERCGNPCGSASAVETRNP
jgi:hypothetical protein